MSNTFSTKKLKATKSESDMLPNEVIFFNPSDSESLNDLLCKFGPEALFDISEELCEVAMNDVDSVMNNYMKMREQNTYHEKEKTKEDKI